MLDKRRALVRTAMSFGLLLATAAASWSTEKEGVALEATSSRVWAAVEPPALRVLTRRVLDHNPELERHRHRVAGLAVQGPRVSSWPEPVAALTWFVMPPETRVGPQVLRVALSQRFPWFGKLELREQVSILATARAEAELETARLNALTEARRLYFELGFLDEQQEILAAERQTLDRFEQSARARYSTGSGTQQSVVRIQAQITQVDQQVLAVRSRRARLEAELVELSASDPGALAKRFEIPSQLEIELDPDALRTAAFRYRPELAGLDAEIARRETLFELETKNRRPDVTVGFGYTMVGRRDDLAAELNPPAGNGDDIFSLSASIGLPVRRAKLEAGIEQAQAAKDEAHASRRVMTASVEREIGDLESRVPLLVEQLTLLRDVLAVQAREALQSAEAAYTIGQLDAVDLLDAEVVLFDVRTSISRIRADLAIAHAELERAIAQPLTVIGNLSS